jgi:hypothetical protein
MSKNPFRDEVVKAELADPYQSPREPEPIRQAKAPRKPYPAAMRMLQLACVFLMMIVVARTKYPELSQVLLVFFVVFCIYCLGEMVIHYTSAQ